MAEVAGVYQAIVSKRDTRAYTDRQIPDEIIRHILQAGRMAGSARAAEPVRFIVVSDPEGRKALAECGTHAPHVASCAVVVALVLLPEFGVVGAPPSIFRGPFDAGRAAQNMMLAAWEEGITSCPTRLQDEEKVARLLTLPEGHVIINVISFGYPSEDEPGRPSRPRAGFDEYVHWEHW
ncbi:MAG TPA: nitroreductase family protein [Dehalococcoidia bacterium]|nr:nitroreductase family protein [Dehalococcoidia bacterium]